MPKKWKTTTTKEKRELIDSARDVAYSLRKQSPITIDDVISKMKELGMETESGNNTWRGTVFDDATSWIKVGRAQSDPKSHGRSLVLFMHRSVIAKDAVFDGTAYTMSRYNLTEIYTEFMNRNKRVSPVKCCWVIGKDTLFKTFLQKIKNNKECKLYGIPVKLVAGVGAVITKDKQLRGD